MYECNIKDKPISPPRMLVNRGIAISGAWECDHSDGQWTWRMTTAEKEEWKVKDPAYQTQFVECKGLLPDVYKVNGEWRNICKDWRGYYYVEKGVRWNVSLNMIKQLLTEHKPNVAGGIRDLENTLLRDKETGEWKGGDIKLPEMPDMPSFGAAKIIGFFIILIALLIALGYSGMGGVVQSEHKRSRG